MADRWRYYGAEIYLSPEAARTCGADDLTLEATAHELDVGHPTRFWIGRLSVAHHDEGGLWTVDQVEAVPWPACWCHRRSAS